MKKLIPLLALLLLLAGCTQSCATATEPVPTPTQIPPAVPTPNVRPTLTPNPTPEPTSSEPALADPVSTPAPTPMPARTPPPVEPAPTPTPAPTPPVVEPEEGPTDEEVLAAYRQAEEAFGWFQLCTLPGDPEGQIVVEDVVYSRVDYPGFGTLSDLRGYLKGLFSDELVEGLLPADGTQYVEIDGVLYVQEGARGGDITKGDETIQILPDGPGRRIVQVSVEVLDLEQDFAVTGSEQHDFPYEKIGDKWIFTTFYLIR